MYACACVCVYIYICAIFCSECCVHFRTGVLGTTAWAGVYVTQVFLWHQHTHLRTHSLQVVPQCICIYMCICMHMYMHTHMRLWYCLTRWGVDTEIFNLCIGEHIHAYVYVCACMRVYVHVYMCVYIYIFVCVYVCIYIYIHTRVGVHMHSCRCILFICTVQSLYYMRVFHRCFLTLACVRVKGLEVGFVSAWVCVCACIRAYIHTNYLGTWCEPRCGIDTWRARRILID